MTTPCTANLRRPSGVTQVNVRSSPSTASGANVAFQASVGATGLPVVDVRADADGRKDERGNVFQWFQLRVPDGKLGWVRGDLLDLVGECGAFGYGTLAAPAQASTLTRAAALLGITRTSPSGGSKVNVRSTPSSASRDNLKFQADAGTSGLRVTGVASDADGRKDLNARVFEWLNVTFPDGRAGWIRDDILDVVGDGSALGYGVVAAPTQASTLKRAGAASGGTSGGGTPVSADAERVWKAAFNVTSTFEGGGENAGYTMYQTYDSGIISYGRFQFTLAAGALADVLDAYLAASTTPTAAELRASYQARVRRRDETLRSDTRLRDLLRAAAAEQAMKDAQNRKATESYWNDVQSKIVAPRRLQTPLAQALLFDMNIHHGFGNLINRYVNWTLEALGLPTAWKAENLADEQRFVQRLAIRRRDELHRQAGTTMGGLRVRGDFWLALVEKGDWNLQGDARGIVTPKSGRTVNVRNPV